MAELIVLQSPQEVANEFASYFNKLAAEYYEMDQKLHVALSGGSTPKIWFETLRKEYKDKIKWSHTCFYWGDERMVPYESSESNFGEAKRNLFDHIEIPKENVFPVSGTNDIEAETTRYSELLSKKLPQNGRWPIFDLLILGMGDDGHTASIFPHQMDLLKSDKVCAKATHPISGQIRLTLTGNVINNARRVVFLITGKNKKDKLKSIFKIDENAGKYPSAYVNPGSGKLIFFADKAAASAAICK